MPAVYKETVLQQCLFCFTPPFLSWTNTILPVLCQKFKKFYSNICFSVFRQTLHYHKHTSRGYSSSTYWHTHPIISELVMFQPSLAQKLQLWLSLSWFWLSQILGQAKAATHNLALAQLSRSLAFQVGTSTLYIYFKSQFLLCNK